MNFVKFKSISNKRPSGFLKLRILKNIINEDNVIKIETKLWIREDLIVYAEAFENDSLEEIKVNCEYCGCITNYVLYTTKDICDECKKNLNIVSKRKYRYLKKGVSEKIANDLSKENRAYVNKISEYEKIERQYDLLSKKNAIEAFDYFLKHKASDIWIKRFYKASGKPWNNPRLSESEKYAIRYRTDEKFNLKERLRNQIKKKKRRYDFAGLARQAIKRNGESTVINSILNYRISELKDHLEKQFTKGMSWDVFLAGDIHIDHIIPLSSFDLSDDDELKRAWCLTNLRPAWADDNRKKSDKILFLL
jgi:5-methylcytosine-specific restriction endonuclease McrA